MDQGTTGRDSDPSCARSLQAMLCCVSRGVLHQIESPSGAKTGPTDRRPHLEKRRTPIGPQNSSWQPKRVVAGLRDESASRPTRSDPRRGAPHVVFGVRRPLAGAGKKKAELANLQKCFKETGTRFFCLRATFFFRTRTPHQKCRSLSAFPLMRK